MCDFNGRGEREKEREREREREKKRESEGEGGERRGEGRGRESTSDLSPQQSAAPWLQCAPLGGKLAGSHTVQTGLTGLQDSSD